MCLGGCVGVESIQVKEQSAFNARVTGVRYEREREEVTCACPLNCMDYVHFLCQETNGRERGRESQHFLILAHVYSMYMYAHVF